MGIIVIELHALRKIYICEIGTNINNAEMTSNVPLPVWETYQIISSGSGTIR